MWLAGLRGVAGGRDNQGCRGKAAAGKEAQGKSKSMKETWPLLHCISSKTQAQFIQCVYDQYGVDLLPLLEEQPKQPAAKVEYALELEDTEEVAKIMSQAPASKKELEVDNGP